MQLARPNPTTGLASCSVHIHEADAMGEALMVVRDIKGSKVFTQKLLGTGNHEVLMDTQNWQPGLYLYSLEIGGRRLQTLKLSVIH